MIGLNQNNGKHLKDLDHLRQSIQVILSTRIGTRVMRRDFGSNVPDLIDEPVNGATVARFAAATARALSKWEPRIKLAKAKVTRATNNGDLEFHLTGTYTPTGEQVQIDGVII